ncbi:MAG: DUF3450 domain-containing protein [Desulfobacteraceae bacterium]|jgi:hypothetical protein
MASKIKEIKPMSLSVFKSCHIRFTNYTVTVCFFLSALSLYPFASAQETEPDSLLNDMVEVMDRSSKAGEKAAKWSRQKQELLSRIRELELKNQWTEFQIERHNTWIKNETEAISVLEARLSQVENIRVALDPLIEVIYARLEESVRNDLPFLQEERSRRLAFLRQELDSTNAGLGHRLGRLLEALQVEALYGQSVDARDIIATIDGVQQQVTVFRLGRLALFRISQDNRLVQIFDKKKNTWKTISAKHSVELRKAGNIAEKKRVTSIVELPVGLYSELLTETPNE